MIYAIHILDQKFVKIGFTRGGVTGRISSLQTGSPFEICLLEVVEGTLLQEQEVHKALTEMFSRAHIPMPPNEWYPGRNPPMQEFLAALPYGLDAALHVLDVRSSTVKQHSPKQGVYCVTYKWGRVKENKRRKKRKL